MLSVRFHGYATSMNLLARISFILIGAHQRLKKFVVVLQHFFLSILGPPINPLSHWAIRYRNRFSLPKLLVYCSISFSFSSNPLSAISFRIIRKLCTLRGTFEEKNSVPKFKWCKIHGRQDTFILDGYDLTGKLSYSMRHSTVDKPLIIVVEIFESWHVFGRLSNCFPNSLIHHIL